MEESAKKSKELLERLRKGSFPPAAIAAAFASFATAALGSESKPTAQRPAATGSTNAVPVPAQPNLELRYTQTSALQPRFRRSLAGLAISAGDGIFVLGDGEVRIFESGGAALRSFKAPENASCIAVGHDGRIYVGASGRVQVFDNAGIQRQAFDAGTAGQPANITAIKLTPKEILIADVAARCIIRCDQNGRRLGEIGNQGKAGGFMLPNRSLDIDVDSKGMVMAADSGRHRVSTWTLDGVPVRHFGKFGLINPEDFVGCCNPVNLAFAPGDKIVTAEKVVARVKVYDTMGKLLALIGPEHFDPKCTRLHLAVDSKGRILVADPVRLEVKIFSSMMKSGSRENV